ncbi:11620_t:CDS:2 [Funneliformis geosporum]|nr:11620_t:CDS:2 [Funneliformis geosporum]
MFNLQTYILGKKSDVYSIGVLLWEISSCRPPFCVDGKQYDDVDLSVRIFHGLRESAISDTPENYVKVYTECWQKEPRNRPTMNQVVIKLIENIPETIAVKSNDQINNYITRIYSSTKQDLQNSKVNLNVLDSSINIPLHGEPSQIFQSVNQMSVEEDYDTIIDEMVYLIFKERNKGIEDKIVNRRLFAYLEILDIPLQKLFHWLLYNQDDSNYIFLLGYLIYYGLGTSVNINLAFKLFLDASNKDHALAQRYVGTCYQFGYGTEQDETLAFKFYEKVASKHYAMGQLQLGYFYENGIGVKKDFKMAASLYEKAANNGNIIAMNNLGNCNLYGKGVDVNNYKGFELFKKSAAENYEFGILNLGNCFFNGIGTRVNEKKAIELFEKAADHGNRIAINNLAICYRGGKLQKEGLEWQKQLISDIGSGINFKRKRLQTLLEQCAKVLSERLWLPTVIDYAGSPTNSSNTCSHSTLQTRGSLRRFNNRRS